MKKWVDLNMHILVDVKDMTDDPDLIIDEAKEEIEAALRESGNKGLLIELGWEKEDGY